MRNSKEKGITLIALIITIIVLLILAGVSIAMVVGDNGILGQATNASDSTDISKTKEEIELALVGYYDDEGKYTRSNVESAVQDVLGNSATIDEADGVYTVTTLKGNTVDITNILNGATTFSKQITVDNYGDSVEYSAGGVDDWKIFYNDGTYVYIIASNCIENSLIDLDSLGMIAYDSYAVYWDTSNFTVTDLSNAQERFMFSGMESMSSSYDNYKAAASLLDTTKWASFVDSTYADYAVGGPSGEMLLSYCIEKGYLDMSLDDVICYESGYYSSAISGNSVISNGSADELLCPSEFRCFCFCSAGPIYGGSYVMLLGYYFSFMGPVTIPTLYVATFDSISTADITSGLRPVVSLKSSVIGTYENDTWILSN